MLYANCIIDLIAFFIVLMLFISNQWDKSRDFSKSLFNILLICVSVYLFSDLIAWYIDGKSFAGAYTAQVIANTLVYASQIVHSYFWLLYTDYWLYRSKNGLKSRALVYSILLVAEFALLIVNCFSGWIFCISDTHHYVRGTYFIAVMLGFYGYGIISVFISIRELIISKDSQRKNNCLWLAAFMVLPVITSVIRLFYYDINVAGASTVLAMLMIYLSIHQRRLAEEMLKVSKHETELQKANTSIMLSQIQPHFLFNSLSAITELCRDNPTAEKALVNFSKYLRGNIDSLRQNVPMPFETELNHVKTYLYLEKLRFQSKLNIVYDIETTDFMIPTLTIQPLVENAVKHGIGRKEQDGTVTLTVREETDFYRIEIKDDGIGFEPDEISSDGKTHIGIENVKCRLASMCKGTISIESIKGSGTTVTVRIPKG